MRATFIVLAIGAVLATAAAADAQNAPSDQPLLQDSAGDCPDRLPFDHVLTDKPLVQFKKDEQITPAVDRLHCSGENAYRGDAVAIAEGKKLYTLCAGCHMPDGTGRMGPNLVDAEHKYERVGTDKGEFEVVYGGAAGAMQPMGRRFTQDQILKVMSYLETLADSQKN